MFLLLIITYSDGLPSRHHGQTKANELPKKFILYWNVYENSTDIVFVKSYEDPTVEPELDYDQKGAYLYVIVVVAFYGVSIAILVTAFIRHDPGQDEVKNFIRTRPNIELIQRANEKVRYCLAIHKHEAHILEKQFHLEQALRTKRKTMCQNSIETISQISSDNEEKDDKSAATTATAVGATTCIPVVAITQLSPVAITTLPPVAAAGISRPVCYTSQTMSQEDNPNKPLLHKTLEDTKDMKVIIV